MAILGAVPKVSLKVARELARRANEQIALGQDPWEQKAKVPTFAEAVAAYLENHQGQWKRAKYTGNWRMTLGPAYCAKLLPMQVDVISVNDVLGVLQPIWLTKAETASRIRSQLERVFAFSKARGWRSGENPAVWKEGLANLLPVQRKATKHYNSMPYEQVPEFVAGLKGRESVAARALEFIIYTAVRCNEALQMKWSEVDWERGLWTVPADRCKMNKPHIVPLSEAALGVLKGLAEVRMGELVFPGLKAGKAINPMTVFKLVRKEGYTIHGFRSSFRDFAGNETEVPREICEEALAHAVGNATERAYRRQ